MVEEEKIIQLLDQNINTIKVKMEDPSFNKLNPLKLVIQELIKVETTPQYLIKISDDKIVLLKEFSSNSEIMDLFVYKELFKNETFNPSQKEIEDLNQICNNIKSKFNSTFLKNDTEMKNLEHYNKRLIELRKKITQGYLDITAQDLQDFSALFNHSNLSPKEAISLIKYITYKYLDNIEKLEQDDEIEELKETNLSQESLIELFNQFGYDFNDLGKNTTEICKYGNIENIKSILEVLKNNNIDLNKLVGNNRLIIVKSKQLTEILLKSNANNVSGVLDIAKTINLLKNGEIDFLYLIETPSRFLSRKKKYKRKTDGGVDGPELIEMYGCYEDFISNIEFLKNKYDQTFNDGEFLNKVFKKCDFIFNYSHQKILNVIKIYDLYDIPPQNYLNSLSGLKSLSQAEVFDLAFELDIMDYIKDNMSMANINPSDELFEQVTIAKRHNIQNIFKNNKRETLMGVKTCIYFNRSYVNECISYQNLTFEKFDIKRFFNEDELKIFEEFESIVSRQANCEINLALNEINNDENSLLKLLEKYRDKDNPNIYIINGIRISRLKVLRLYTTLKLNGIEPSIYSFIYILTKNSFITQEEFEELYNTVNILINKKVKKV